mmetsp:Transcript_54934/g.116745  ORF Transcript_54934/g.116745 Transcript_54934/m.116745 type:complete len:178 (-) Transcript_54934:242-775(-)
MAYRRVATSDQNDDAGPTNRGGLSSDDEMTSSPSATVRSQSERISDKLHAMAWVVAAYAIASYTRLFHKVFTDERIVRPILHVSVALFSVNVVLTLYLTVYLPFKFPVTPTHKTPASSPAFWEVYCPRVIPTMTACGVIGSFLLVRACYPVWGFLSPFILGVVALGMFFSLHFIPWC